MRFLLFFMLLLAVKATAQEGSFQKVSDPKQAEQKLVRAAGSVQTITSGFIQEKHLEYLSAVITSKGKFWFRKPAGLRWEYTEPYKYLVLIDEGKITLRDEGKKNAFDAKSSKSFRELNEIMVGALNGSLTGSKKYSSAFYEDSNTWLLRLTPKDIQLGKVLKYIELYFPKKDNAVDRIKLVEPSGDYTLITLVNKKFNEVIPAGVFLAK